MGMGIDHKHDARVAAERYKILISEQDEFEFWLEILKTEMPVSYLAPFLDGILKNWSMSRVVLREECVAWWVWYP